MRLFCSLALALFLGSACTLQAADETSKKPAEAKAEDTTTVKLRDLSLTLPKSWSASDQQSQMRLATYFIPAAAGDKDKGELAISTFAGGGGGIAPNLQRWISQFDAAGRKAVVKKGKAGANEYYIADISGTYQKSVGPPILRKTEPAPNYRMLGVIVVLPSEEVYFLKLTGPDATVKAQAETLRKSFGGKSEGEEDFEL
ncbi:MAG: hypothetical protein RIT02_2054 [Planctomycetota bacterium]|jgi:hypothetical protein